MCFRWWPGHVATASVAELGSCQWEIKRPAPRSPAVRRCSNRRLDAPKHAPDGPVITGGHRPGAPGRVPGAGAMGIPRHTTTSVIALEVL